MSCTGSGFGEIEADLMLLSLDLDQILPHVESTRGTKLCSLSVRTRRDTFGFQEVGFCGKLFLG
jgi:hypothetical protein